MLYEKDFRAEIGDSNNISDSFLDDEDDSVALLAEDLLSDFENNINDGCRGYSSLSWEYKTVSSEIVFDLALLDSKEREMALEFLRDKLELRRGMRGEDPNPPRTFKRLTKAERKSAHRHVKDRVKKLRQERNKVTINKKEPIKRVSKLRQPAKHSLLKNKNIERKVGRPLQPKNVY